MLIALTVALVYNLKRDAGQDGEVPCDYYSEYDSPQTVTAIAETLRQRGYRVELIEAGRDLLRWFQAHPVDVVLNIAEGVPSENRESHVPALLSALGIPYTGSDSFTLALALDKAKTKSILLYEGIPTPRFQLFRSGRELLREDLRFPLIVKPNREGSAKGITVESVVREPNALRAQVTRVLHAYRQEALIEEFIEGTELTVGVLGDAPPRALPILEIDFSSCRDSGEYFYSWRMKEFQGDAAQGLMPQFHCPARLSPSQARTIQLLAVRAHTALGCRGFSRTDVRLSRGGVPYVLEVNPLPGLDPVDSNFPKIARAAGLSYGELLEVIVSSGLTRHASVAQGGIRVSAA